MVPPRRSLGRRAVERRDERLAARTDARPARPRRELVEATQKLERLPRVLGEAEARIEPDVVVGHARRDGARSRPRATRRATSATTSP